MDRSVNPCDHQFDRLSHSHDQLCDLATGMDLDFQCLVQAMGKQRSTCSGSYSLVPSDRIVGALLDERRRECGKPGNVSPSADIDSLESTLD